MTINETIDGQSQVQQQDRKGLGLALGPEALSAGVKHHVLMSFGEDRQMDPKGTEVEIFPKDGYRVFDYSPKTGETAEFSGEMLSLGTWLSISGAAFSTGTGFRTSLGMSLLAGLANIRLGRWWGSGIDRQRNADGCRTPEKLAGCIERRLARLFPVQVHLFDEFLARFPGTARPHWYLSDGGHFENLGGYELIRRRLPLIVIVDAERDTDYRFEGLANLVRKARLDFGAEIEFLDGDQLNDVLDGKARPAVGTLEQLRRGEWSHAERVPDSEGPREKRVRPDRAGLSLAHAALARVTYVDCDPSSPHLSWLLYVKPTLTGGEPVDVVEYHRTHPAFPPEPTIDQFFDEAQWESYRRLGEHIGSALFGSVDRLAGAAKSGEKALFKDWSWTNTASEGSSD